MNHIALFCAGIGVFAMTVYGAVMAGGLALARIAENDDLRDAQNVEAPSH